MKTQVEFRSDKFPARESEEHQIDSGRYGKRADLQKEPEGLFKSLNKRPRQDATCIPATFWRVPGAVKEVRKFERVNEGCSHPGDRRTRLLTRALTGGCSSCFREPSFLSAR